jgi:hypothetical protein
MGAVMDANVHALRSWTIKKKGEEFFIAATGQSARTAGAARTRTCNAHHSYRKAPVRVRAGNKLVRSDRVRALNDAFSPAGGDDDLRGDELPDCVRTEALRQVATFCDFTPDNSTTSAASRSGVVNFSGRSSITIER